MVLLLLTLLPYKAGFLSEPWPDLLRHCALSAYPNLVFFFSLLDLYFPLIQSRVFVHKAKAPPNNCLLPKGIQGPDSSVLRSVSCLGPSGFHNCLCQEFSALGYTRVTERAHEKYSCHNPLPQILIFCSRVKPVTQAHGF